MENSTFMNTEPKYFFLENNRAIYSKKVSSIYARECVTGAQNGPRPNANCYYLLTNKELFSLTVFTFLNVIGLTGNESLAIYAILHYLAISSILVKTKFAKINVEYDTNFSGDTVYDMLFKKIILST